MGRPRRAMPGPEMWRCFDQNRVSELDGDFAATTIIVGGIGEKAGVVDGHIATREYLSMTISFDHDIIDGAPAARFTQRLKELIESGSGLFDSTVESGQTPLSSQEVNYVYNSRESNLS